MKSSRAWESLFSADLVRVFALQWTRVILVSFSASLAWRINLERARGTYHVRENY